MRICLVLEGCYPYVTGGVSSWAHQLINAFPEHEFVLWTVVADSEDAGKFVYELPENVVEVREVVLNDALKGLPGRAHVRFTPEQRAVMRDFVHCADPDWDVLFDAMRTPGVTPMGFLMSETFLDLMTDICRADYPYSAFSDMFHTMRSMLLPVLHVMGGPVPQADVYHTIAAGYSGILACLGGYVNHAPVMLSEHGIYSREREEEIIRARWVLPAFKRLWVRFFYMLSRAVYNRASIVTSLFGNARKAQVELGCAPEKCRITPNGVNVERFGAVPPKTPNGWVDIGAVVRIAPIKDVKTLLYAFAELKHHVDNVRLYVIGPEEDKEYAAECYELVRQLQVRDVVFTGRANVVEYLAKVDFTMLTSISEGMPLSVLESFAAGRPCVTTDVGCCRELIEGGEGDDLGIAGMCVEPMNRMALASAMERMCTNADERLAMGEAGKRRASRFYRQERMVATYRELYQELCKAGATWQG